MEQLRAGIEGFLAGTSESAREDMLSRSAERWDPDIELDALETPVLDISGVYRGRDAVKRFWREWLMLFDMRMRGRSTGIDVPFGKVARVFTYRGGVLIHQKFYMGQSDALKAVGLVE